MKISGKFPGSFRNSENSRKISPEISRKFSGKFPESSGYFFIQIQWYSAKITIFIIRKVVELQENFGKISGKISEMSKIPGRNFSGKFPGNSGEFFRVNVMLQSKNHFF